MGNVLKADRPADLLWQPEHLLNEAPDNRPAPQQQSQPLKESRFRVVEVRQRDRREAVALGVLAFILHASAVYWLSQRSTPRLPEVPVQVPPMTIEFSSPAPTPPQPAPAVAPTPPPPPAPPAPVVDELATKPPPPKPVAKPKTPPPPKPVPKKVAPKPAEPTPPKPAAATAPAAPQAPATPAAAAPAAAAAPLTPPSANAGYLRNPAPEYPALAMRRSWEGTVLLRVHVLPNGKPSEIQVQKSSGRDLLDEAAVKAVKNWSFVPAKRGDVPQEGWVSVPIDFKLN